MADEFGHLPRRPGRILLATKWSLQGLRAAWLYESSFRLEVYLMAVLAPLGLWLGQSGVERALHVAEIALLARVAGDDAVVARAGAIEKIVLAREVDERNRTNLPHVFAIGDVVWWNP